ncbi:DNA-processing protein DprA [Ruminococcaceae bacterium OttesenSCG-928-O06]|nr:DNA-processing protein DprA [Ruminococcaceae bacterium OttesenSCG-928-O06]
MTSEYWMWLAGGLGYGAVNSGELLAAFPGGAKEIYESLGSERLDEILTQKQAEKLAQSRPQDFSLRIRHMESVGVHALGYDDDAYPAMLRHTTNPPPVLFVKGELGLMNGQLSVGIVGARRPSAYGVEVVKAIGRGVALGGAIVISGLAAGLDAEAHKAALAVNGPTIACIAFGHDHCYPAANRKLMEVIENHGAVVSEYPVGTEPEKPFFLQRNRIIAGLSHALLVTEARRHSGTMSTVNFAIDYGRDVFAVPGSIFSELSTGTNAMIKEGAYLAGSASDILALYGVELKEEDPVAAAARQAGEGRPPAASAAPPWQQNLKRYSERTRAEQQAKREELPGQQSLAEGAPAAGAAPLTTAAAIEAFRMLQRELPPDADSEVEARNKALDEMVAAVSDSVDISPKKRGEKPPATKQAEPFPWHKVERIDKAEVEDLSPAVPEEEKKKPSFAARLFGAGEKAQQETPAPPPEVPVVQPAAPETPPNPPATPAAPVVPKISTEPVGRVSAVSRVEAVTPAQPAEPVQPTQAADAAAAQSAAQPVPPAPQSAAPAGTGQKAPAQPPPRAQNAPRTQRGGGPSSRSAARANAPLAQRLNTLKTEEPPAQKPSAQSAQKAKEQAEEKALLSEEAKRALRQLGAKPVPLSEICERSGLAPAAAMAALTELELAGLSRQLAGRQFVAV